MRNRTPLYLFLTAILVFACNLPAAVPVTSPPQGLETATSTVAPDAAATQTVTATISTAPFASPNSDALNCRTGPSTNYDVAAVLNLGQKAEIVGRTSDGSWLNVKNRFLPGNFCWVSAGFVTTSGDLSGLQIVVVPPTPTGAPSSTGIVNYINVSINPNTIHVGGCIGPIQAVSLYAKIGMSGPGTIKWHFKDQQTGNLSSHNLTFKKADIQDVSDSFTPPVNAGNYKVTLVIEGVDLKGFYNSVSYKITC